MPRSNLACTLLFIVFAIVQFSHSLSYSDLETVGISCPNLQERYKCAGYRSVLTERERGCECDATCNVYKDCCINAPRRDIAPRPSIRDRMTCLQVGPDDEMGVYAVSTCRGNWVGSSEIRRKCEGPLDLSDPLNAAPVTNDAQGVTFRNRYCAECNEANLENLKTFQLQMSCGELEYLTDEQIYADLRYDKSQDAWGIDRWDSSRNATNFVTCLIVFDVPSYLNNVRFCKSNVISSCPPDYERHIVRQACEDYMAVVYYNAQGYRNPHCAICNDKTVIDLSCISRPIGGRKPPMSIALLLDINMSDGILVGKTQIVTPECPRNHRYDPFFKMCRRFVCIFPGDILVDGKCVRRT